MLTSTTGMIIESLSGLSGELSCNIYYQGIIMMHLQELLFY